MAIIDNTIAGQMPQYDAGAPLQEAAKIQSMQAEASAAQFKDKQNQIGAEMRGLSPFVNSAEFPAKWAQTIDTLHQRGLIPPQAYDQLRSSPSPLMLKSIIAKTEDPAVTLQKQQLEQSKINADRNYGLAANADRRAAKAADEDKFVIKEVTDPDSGGTSFLRINPRTGESSPIAGNTTAPQAAPVQNSAPQPAPASVTTPWGDMPAGAIPGGQPAGAGLSGDSYLATMNPRRAAIVKGLADLEIDPKSLSITGGHRERLLADAKVYDPNFDAAKIPARFAAQKEFTAGGPNSPAAMIMTGGTTIGHLLHGSDLSEKLGGPNGYGVLTGPINRANEKIMNMSNNPDLASYNGTAGRIAEEGTKFYRGIGGTESDIKRDIENMGASSSLESRRAALATQATLMLSKVGALQDRWRNSLGPRQFDKAMQEGGFPVITQERLDQVNTIRARAGMKPVDMRGNETKDASADKPDPLGIR